MSNENAPTPEAEASSLPVSGRLLKSVKDNFALRTKDDEWAIGSVGLAPDSIVATDNNSAILIGANVGGHVATLGREALLEAHRSTLYGDAVRLDAIERLLDKRTKEPVPMPNVRRVIHDKMREMRPLATVDPAALRAIGKVASDAGAITVDLFQPEGDAKALGFRFSFEPDPRHVNLFQSYEGSVEARGVFMTVQGAGGRSAVDDDEEGEAEGPAEAGTVETAVRGSRASGETVTAAPAKEPTPEPAPETEVAVDVSLSAPRGAYRLPPLSLLEVRLGERATTGGHEAGILQLLRENNVAGRIDRVRSGPRLTQYELSVPGTVKVSRVAGLADDFQMQLGVQSVRIEAPIPGKKAIGIEVPNPSPRTVGLLDLCARRGFVDAKSRLWVALGEDVGGEPVYYDLAKAPHLLVAGATNSGKSIGVASILASLLLRNTPKDLRLVMIDPKRVELTLFDRIPHLMCPVITDVKEAAGVLRAVWREMDRRYDVLSEASFRNLDGYNAKAPENDRMPSIVVVVDELADLMLQCGAEVETVVVRLAQLARAVGIHMVIATQRPSVDVVTGLIKANVPSRIAFAVASGVDSRVILDGVGAERLLGRGDMLFSPIEGGGKPTRVQGAFVSEDEVAAICRFWREQAAPSYTISAEEPDTSSPEPSGEDDAAEGGNALFEDAERFARERGEVSTSMLQRRFSVGFQRASRLLALMERRGVVGPHDGPHPRKVLPAPEPPPDPFPAVCRWAAARPSISLAEIKEAFGVNHQRAIVLLGELHEAGVIDDMGNPRPRVLMDAAAVERMLEVRGHV